MKNDKLVGWLSVGSQLAVFAGLGLVAFEISQAHAQIQLLGLADTSDNFTQAMETLSQDEGLARLIYTAESGLRGSRRVPEMEGLQVPRRVLHGMSEQDCLVYLRVTDAAQANEGFENGWQENMARPMYRDYRASSEGRLGRSSGVS